MGFVAHWIPALLAGLLLAVVGFVLRAKVRHRREERPAAAGRVVA